MDEDNQVTSLNVTHNKIGTPGLAVLLKSLRFSFASDLKIAIQKDLNQKVKRLLKRFINDLINIFFILSV